jgi:MSHA biogenesis protein MshL
MMTARTNLFQLFQLLPLLAGLIACSERTPAPNVNAAFDPLPPSKLNPAPSPAVMDALLPPTNTLANEPRFDLNVIDADARAFFLSLAAGTDYNIVVHPDVAGKLSLQLRNVSMPEVLTIARDVYGYEFVRSGNLFTVSGSGLQTVVIPLNYLNLKRSGQTETRVSAGQASSNNGGGGNSGTSNNSGGGAVEQRTSTLIETKNESDWWKELETSLKTLLSGSEGNQIIVNANAGLVILRARPADLRLARQFLQSAESSMNRQVILEAKIVEVTLGQGFQAGIDWTNLQSQLDGDTTTTGLNGQVIQTVPSATPINGIFSAAFNGSDFNATIELLKTQGDVQVLSSPRVATVNNQKAVIKVGTDEFFVTNVSSSNVVGGGGASSTPQINFSSFFSGIALDVTPQISETGDIVLHMHPSVSDVRDQTKALKVFGTDFTLPLALSSVRETDAIVRARSGQIVVIGGLMQDKVVSDQAGIPWLSDLPWIGGIFRQTRESTSKSELVILLRAVLADDVMMQNEVDRSTERLGKMRQP